MKNIKNSIFRGQVWLANLDPTIGSEIKKTRPVLVVSNDINNTHNSVVTIIPITSNVEKVFSFEVFIEKNIANLPKDSKVKTDQLRTIDKKRLVKPLGEIPESLMKNVSNAIKLHLDL
jgi:mRNA interferase MazF